MCPQIEVGQKSEVVIGGTSDELFDVHVATVRKGLVHLVTTCHVNVGRVCNVASGGGETCSPPPKPIVYLFRHDEDTGGGGIALQAFLSHCGCTLAMLHRALQGVAVGIHPETFRRDK